MELDSRVNKPIDFEALEDSETGSFEAGADVTDSSAGSAEDVQAEEVSDNVDGQSGQSDNEQKSAEDIEFDDVFSADNVERDLNKELSSEMGNANSDEGNVVADSSESVIADSDNSDDESMADKKPEINLPQFENVDKILSEAISAIPVVAKSNLAPDENAKKYVIYIDSDNVSYMEELSVNDRRKVINNVLREQLHYTLEERERRHRRKYFSHFFLALITFLICFPLFFIFVNKAAKVSIVNFNNAKANFSKLYKPYNKIKPY